MAKYTGKAPLKDKISNIINKFKSHWKTPHDGYQVCYRKFGAFAGVGLGTTFRPL